MLPLRVYRPDDRVVVAVDVVERVMLEGSTQDIY